MNIGDTSRIQFEGIRPENIFWNVSGKIIIGNLVEMHGVYLSRGELSIGQFITGDRTFFSNENIKLGELNEEISSYSHLVSISILHQEELATLQCNYVSNYSFETGICPTNSGQIDYATGWFDAGENPTGADLFGCVPCLDAGNRGCYGTPQNLFGNQDARTGDKYAGIYVFSNRTNVPGVNHLGYREFLGNTLVEPLKNGRTYKVEFYVSASDNNLTFSSNIGLHFSNKRYSKSNQEKLINGDNPQIPQILSSTIITNQTNWTKIEGTYLANGTEQYLYIGNFDSDWQMNFSPVGVNACSRCDDSYYYIDDVKVVESGTPLVVDAGSDKCNKTLQGVQLGGVPSASGGSFGSGVYTYNWTPSTGLSSTTVANPIANPTTQTTYKLKVEDVNGCAEYDEVTVYVEDISHYPNITPFDKYDNFEDMAIEFRSDCKNCNKVVWEFGDGSTYTSITPNATIELVYHTYTKPGNYFVKTHYYNECYTQSQRNVIYVAPNIKASNNTIGINYRTYISMLVNNFVNPYSNAKDITITSQLAPISNPLIWSTLGSRFEIKGELRIKSGASLVISDITVMFGPYGKIIVEPGANLKLNGCTLRGFKGQNAPQDEFMWFGIEVQSKIDDNNVNYIKGNLTMVNNATIKDAHIGIIIGESITTPINGSLNQVDFGYNYHVSGTGGGMLQIDGAKFINNGTSIRFYGQDYFLYNKSIIKNSSFTSTSWGLKDPYYYSENEDYFELKGHNPHILGSNPNINFPIGRSSQGIDVINMKGVEISNNTFNGINHPVTLTNSRAIKVKTNTFDNSPLAIYINGIFDVYSNNTIYDNTFKKLVQTCIKTKGSNGDNIQSNLIRNLNPPTSVISTEGPAIELESANFIVRDNIIKDYGTAIKVIGDPISSNYGFIGNKLSGNNIEANSFMPLITTEGNNKKLLIKCNEFSYFEATANTQKRVWQISDVFGNQGIPKTNTALYPKTTPAGNIFDRISANPVRKIDNSDQTYASFYYRHTNNFCTLVPDDSWFNVIDSKEDYIDYATSCVLPVITDPIPIKLHIDALRGIANTFNDELTTVTNNLDQSNTDELISLLNTTEDWDDIRTTILDHSPLSENVLGMILNSPNSISEEGFLSIMTHNLPIYDNLNADLNTIIKDVFPNIKEEIEDIIGYNPTIRTPKAVEIDIDKTEKEKMFYVTNYLEIMDQTDELENALVFLDEDYSNDITKVQFSDAFYQGNYSQASNYRNKIVVNNDGDQSFADYSNFLLSIKSDDRTYWEMDSLEKEFLYSFATQCPKTMESKQAINLIKVVFGDTVANCNAYSGRINSNTLQPLSTENRTRFLGDGYPNPANNKFYIPYKTDDVTNSYMEIYDINGSIITKKKITNKQGTIAFDVDQLSSGIYFYKLLIKGMQVEVKRLAKIK